VLTLAVGLTLVAGAAAAQPPPAAGPAGAPPRGLADPYVGKKKLLIWAEVQTGFQHDDINHAMAVIEELGRKSGAYISVLRTDSQLITKKPILGVGARYTGRGVNTRNLSQYDAIFYLGSGEGTLTADQKADLLSFVHDDGKGFVAGHASTVGFYNWPEFGQMIGGFMDTEYPIQPMPLIVADPKFPGANAFGNGAFSFSDQFPILKEPYAKGKVHTIIRLDPSKMTAEQKARRPDGDMPVVFALEYGKGRVYNSAFGHPDETWDDPRVQTMYLEAIKWAMRITDAPVPLDKP
jgi:type 1 glutamine amidotransferase